MPGWCASTRPGISRFRVRASRAPERRSLHILFVELGGHQGADRLERGLGFRSGCGDDNGSAGSCRQHHQPHDRRAAHGLAALRHPNIGVEALDHLHEFRRSPRVKPALVDDWHFAGYCAFRNSWPRSGVGRRVVAHLPASTRLAMVTYLRPASCAMAIASGSDRSSRTLASLTSMGRLMPASTSTFGRLMQEIVKLDGVPPNMSVRIATPSPLSTRLTASMISRRRCSTSSSGPIVTASICCCGPTTCSKAERNSTASRPCVTSTSPIIEFLAGASRCTARMGTILTILCPSARGVPARHQSVINCCAAARRPRSPSEQAKFLATLLAYYGYRFPHEAPTQRSNLRHSSDFCGRRQEVSQHGWHWIGTGRD